MPKENKKFTVGEKVIWSSQGGGYKKEKVGKVIDVLAPLENPLYNKDNKKYSDLYHVKYDGNRRDHESYLVLVGNKLYHPRVSGLDKVV